MAIEDPKHWIWATTEETWRREETVNIEREIKVAETKLDSYQIAEKINPTSKCLKHQESPTSRLNWYEGI